MRDTAMIEQVTGLRVHDYWHGECPLLGPSLYVWVQGCPRRCRGCFNQATLSEDGPSRWMTAEDIAVLWTTRRGGLVLSGGEPFSQAAGLADACRAVRSHDPDVPILAYSGYRIEELLDASRPEWAALLKQLDVLVDGPYVDSKPSNHPLTGSINQRIFRFSDRTSAARLAALDRPQVSVSLEAAGRVRIVGTGSAGADMNRLVELIRLQGLDVDG